MRQRKPLIYQETAGLRHEVAGRYVKQGKRQIGFEVGAYDPTQPLVIDPVLVYSTYLSGASSSFGIAVDAAGAAYVAGYTDGSNFQNVLGGVITANTLAKRRFVFPAVTTDRIRVVVNDSADHLFSRIAEIEAFTCTPGCPAPQGDNWKIAFETNRDGNSEIYLADADGSNPTRLTNNGARGGDPFFSPDGSRLIFPSNRDGNYEIYLMNADDTGQTRLTVNNALENTPISQLIR